MTSPECQKHPGLFFWWLTCRYRCEYATVMTDVIPNPFGHVKVIQPPDVDRCGTCRFWMVEAAQSQGEGQPRFAFCRRYPPTVVVLPQPMQADPAELAAARVDPRKNSHQQQQVKFIPAPQPVMPVTGENHWCGEFDGTAFERKA